MVALRYVSQIYYLILEDKSHEVSHHRLVMLVVVGVVRATDRRWRPREVVGSFGGDGNLPQAVRAVIERVEASTGHGTRIERTIGRPCDLQRGGAQRDGQRVEGADVAEILRAKRHAIRRFAIFEHCQHVDAERADGRAAGIGRCDRSR